MKNFKISKKLYVTFGITIILLLIMGSLSIYGLYYSGSRFDDFYEYSYPMSNKTLDVRRGVQTSIKALSMSMLTLDKKTSKNSVIEADTELAGVRENLLYLRDHYRGDTSKIEEAIQILEDGSGIRGEIQELALANNNNEASVLFFDKYVPLMMQIRDVAMAMDTTTSQLADSTYSSANHIQIVITILSIALAAITVLIALILAVYLTRSLKKPIEEIERAAQEMAAGSLSVTVTYESKDELGSLSSSMMSMCANLKEIILDIGRILASLADGDFHVTSTCLQHYVGDYVPILAGMRLIRNNLNATLRQINQSADFVAEGAVQMAGGAQSLAEGATEQAEAIQELTMAVENVSTIAGESADASEAAYHKVYEAGQNASSSQEDLKALIGAMGSITNTSKEIENIIDSIEDVASQTNLLSLNASIEAARAGEAGKGFAVVADEIGKLASDSAKSAVDTRELIAKSLNEINDGNRITQKTVKAIEGILESIKEFAVSTKGISVASRNQADLLKQIEQGIEQISRVVQSNSSAAQETSATSEELSAQAEGLKEQIGKFRLLDC